MVNYTPVPDLIQIIENRECFQAVIPDAQIYTQGEYAMSIQL